LVLPINALAIGEVTEIFPALASASGSPTICQTRFSPEIERRQALFVINLPVRTMAGEKSEGMIFDIGFSDAILPRLAVPETSVPNGARAG
jgi:hypothetical protein